jgi:hypothetical protein
MQFDHRHSTAFDSRQQNFGGIQQMSGAFNSSQQNFGGIQQQLTRHSARHSKRPFCTTFRKLVMAITPENGVHTFLPQLSGRFLLEGSLWSLSRCHVGGGVALILERSVILPPNGEGGTPKSTDFTLICTVL